MPLTRLSHPMWVQPPCVSSWPLMWPEIVSRDRQLRSARLLGIGAASLGRLVGSVAKKLGDSILAMGFARCGWRLGVDLQLVWRTFNVWSNVDARPSPPIGSRLGMRVACTVGLETNGCGERTW